VQLRGDIAIDRASRIVLKLGGDKLSCCLRWMIASETCLRIAFKLIEGNADALAVHFSDPLIAADQRGERDRFWRGEGCIPPGAMLHRLDGLVVGILILRGCSLPHELLPSLWMLARWITDSMFQRYNIVENSDVASDAGKLKALDERERQGARELVKLEGMRKSGQVREYAGKNRYNSAKSAHWAASIDSPSGIPKSNLVKELTGTVR